MAKWIATRFFVLYFLLGVSVFPASAMPPPLFASSGYVIGSIVIKTKERKLLYVEGRNNVVTYSIAVGKAGRKWSGTTTISRKVLNPAWAPPPLIRKSNPKLPALIKPGPNNPLGAAVLVLGDGTYGIHGTNRDETIGTDASFGCFRMHNSDILSLIKRVKIGTVVYVQK
jgi:lipoprotein-anchoring transpeptidase ErfK/SrfK